MQGMKQVLKEAFELWVRMCWLKKIDKEIGKHNALADKIERKQILLRELQDRYHERYLSEK